MLFTPVSDYFPFYGENSFNIFCSFCLPGTRLTGHQTIMFMAALFSLDHIHQRSYAFSFHLYHVSCLKPGGCRRLLAEAAPCYGAGS